MLKHIPDKIFLLFHKKIKARIVCNFIKEGDITCGYAAGVFVTYRNLSNSEYISKIIKSIDTIKTEDTKSLIIEKIHSLSLDDIKEIEDRCGLKVLNGRSEIVAYTPYLLREICKLRKKQLNEREILIISDDTALTKELTVNISRDLRFLTILSKDMTFLEKLEKEVLNETGLSLQTIGKLDRVVQNFDIIINMTADISLDTRYIRRNAIIIDISVGRVLKNISSNRKDLIVITDLLFKNDSILKSNPEVFSLDKKIPSYIYEGIKAIDDNSPIAIRVNHKDYSFKELVDVYYGKYRNSSVFLSK